jgi:DNA-binding IclR family transcriptional regulator
MSALKLAFNLFANMPRDFSAKDLEVRLPVAVANTRELVSTLRQAGKIERTHRQGREQMYRIVPGATPPEDGRIEHMQAVNKARMHIRNMKRIRAMRKVGN